MRACVRACVCARMCVFGETCDHHGKHIVTLGVNTLFAIPENITMVANGRYKLDPLGIITGTRAMLFY